MMSIQISPRHSLSSLQRAGTDIHNEPSNEVTDGPPYHYNSRGQATPPTSASVATLSMNSGSTANERKPKSKKSDLGYVSV